MQLGWPAPCVGVCAEAGCVGTVNAPACRSASVRSVGGVRAVRGLPTLLKASQTERQPSSRPAAASGLAAAGPCPTTRVPPPPWPLVSAARGVWRGGVSCGPAEHTGHGSSDIGSTTDRHRPERHCEQRQSSACCSECHTKPSQQLGDGIVTCSSSLSQTMCPQCLPVTAALPVVQI